MTHLALMIGFLTADRADIARKNVEPKIRGYARAAGTQFPPRQVMLRVLKDEKKMEVWGGNGPTSPLKRLVKYTILAAAGELGPKRQNGDRQVPEGWYFIDRFNPNSSYLSSLNRLRTFGSKECMVSSLWLQDLWSNNHANSF